MFKKVGDAHPILDIMDTDGNIVVCDKCDKPIKVLAINEEDVEPICECQIEE